MARFEAEMPTELMKTFGLLGDDAKQMLGEMTRAGAEAALRNIRANVPPSFRDSQIMGCLKITRTYETPSDGGINTKDAFYGYFENKRGELVPAELVCNVYEYGRRKNEKHPFMRKSFNKRQIKAAMLAVQDKYIKGD